jgi:HK97 family phage portal protein
MATTTRAVARWREKVGTAIAGRPSSSPYRVIYGDPHTTPSYNPHFRDYTSYLQAVKKVPWVYACCKAIAYNVANAEAALYKRVPNGEPERVENDMFLTLWNQPNRFRNGFSFRERLCFDLELTGNFFTSLEEWSWLGLPTAMYRLRPDLVTITPDPDELVAEYVYGQGRKKIHYAPGEVLHISYPNPEDELYGMGVIEAAEYRMNSARAMGQHEATFWENGAKITGVLQSDQKLPDPQFKRLQQTFAKFIRGSGFATLILEGGVKYQAISASPARLGLVELEKMSREEILGLFGVPPTKVGIIDSANYKALAADEAFWVEKIDPTLTRIEVSVQPLVDLFHPSVAPGTYFLKYEEIDFKGDATRLENVARMSSTKTRTLNEMRDYEGLDALPNGDIIIFEAQNFYFDAKKGEFTPIVAPKAQNPALEAHQEAGKPLLSAGKKTADGMVPIEMELDHVGDDGQLYYRVKANPYRLETGHFAHPFADIYPHQLPRVTTDAGTKVQCPGLTPGHYEKRPGVPWYSVMLARACERDGYTRAVAQQMLAHDAYRGPFRRQAETREEALAQLRRASVDRYGHPYAAMAPGVNLTDVKFSRRDAQDAVVAVRDQLIAWADEHGRAQVARAFRSLRDAALRRAERTKKAELRPEAIVDAGEAQDALSAALVEIYERAADAGYDAAEAVQLAINPTEEAIRRIQGELAGRLPGILETTRAQIGEQIAEGLRRSYSARQIAHGYPAEEYGGIAQVFERAETSRAEMIARTEATHAFNRYNVAALDAAGVEHVQVHDGTEFDEPCRERNGRIVPINEAAEMELSHPNCTLHFSPVNRASDREAETAPDGDGKMWSPTDLKYNTHHGEHGHFASTGGGKGKAGDSGEAPVSSASKPDPHGPRYKSLDEYEKSDEGRKIKSLIDEGNLNDVHTGDGALRVAMDRAGFSGKPKVVSKKEMDALIASGSHIEVFRGFGKDADSAAHAEQYRSGEHYAGKGIFGNGTYTTTLRTTAQNYANKPGALVRMAIPRDAHMIDYLDRQKRIVEPNLDRHAKEEEGIRKKLRATKMTDDDLYTALNRKTMNNALYNNEAVAAVHHGYDVVHVPARPGGDGEEFYVVLNRSKMVVQKGAG